jgi:dTDP-N-acetylfucosamine:lipid II N-acetylfucosaminyltransferase
VCELPGAYRFLQREKALAKAVIAKAKRIASSASFFHGQFNTGLWLALLSGGLNRRSFNWHIWGRSVRSLPWLKFRLFYPLRRMAQGRVGCVFATRGDLSYFADSIRTCAVSCSISRRVWIRR